MNVALINTVVIFLGGMFCGAFVHYQILQYHDVRKNAEAAWWDAVLWMFCTIFLVAAIVVVPVIVWVLPS